MDKQLTVQEALKKLLAEKKFLLSDSNALTAALKERVAPQYTKDLRSLSRALVDGHVGELFLAADDLEQSARDKVKTDALLALKQLNMLEERANFAVQTLVEALGWNEKPPTKKPADEKPPPPKPQKTFQEYYSEGVKNVLAKNFDSALDSFNQAIKLNPTNADAYNKRGQAFFAVKKFLEALEDFHQALTLNPRLTAAYVNRGKVYQELAQPQKALEDFHQALTLNPNDKAVRDLQETLRKQMNPPLVTETSPPETTKTPPPKPQKTFQEYYSEGVKNVLAKNFDSALDSFNQAIKLNPTNADAYNQRGNVFRQLERYMHALYNYNQAIVLNADLTEAYFNRGLVYMELNNLDAALIDVNKTLELNPNHANAQNVQKSLQQKLSVKHFNDGCAKIDAHNYGEALESFNRAIAIDSRFSEAYFNRGFVHMKLNNLDAARTDVNRVLKLNPNHANALALQKELRLIINPPKKSGIPTFISIATTVIAVLLGLLAYSTASDLRKDKLFIFNNEQNAVFYNRVEKYFGYGSDSFYATPVVILDANGASKKISVYASKVVGENSYAYFQPVNGIDLKWDDEPFNNHRTTVIVTPGSERGYYLVHFCTKVDGTDDDEFDVLVIVK